MDARLAAAAGATACAEAARLGSERGLVASDVVAALPDALECSMRSDVAIDLGAVRRNAARLLEALEGAAAVGGRQGGCLRARRR